MDARELIIEADRIRQEKGLSQAEWSRVAGLDDCGMAVSRAYNKGNCKLTVLTKLVHSLGYDLVITRKDGENEPGKGSQCI